MTNLQETTELMVFSPLYQVGHIFDKYRFFCCYTLAELERCLAFDALALLGGNEYLVQVGIFCAKFFLVLFVGVKFFSMSIWAFCDAFYGF